MLPTQRLTINDGTQRATPVHDTDMPTVVHQCHVVSRNLERYRVGYIQIVVGQGIVTFPANMQWRQRQQGSTVLRGGEFDYKPIEVTTKHTNPEL